MKVITLQAFYAFVLLGVFEALGCLDYEAAFSKRPRVAVNGRDADGTAPLHLAARNGNVEICELLISRGANVNVTTDDGNTPLHVSVCEGHSAVTQLLTKHGANLEAKNAKGNSPLQSVCDFNIHFPGYESYINNPDNDGNTPLHLKCREGNWGVARILVIRGADSKIRNNDGDTALHLAVRQNHLDVVKLLREYGVNIDAKNAEGDTALHVAYRQKHSGIIKYLKRHGADVSVKNVEGLTPLEVKNKRKSRNLEYADLEREE